MKSLRRSLLFVPGNNPGMILSAPVFGSDAIILDLEDSVAPNQKDAARRLVSEALKTLAFGKIERVVRVNALSTPFGEEDIKTILAAKPDTLLVPKAEPESLRRVSAMVDEMAPETGIIALLETALGVELAYQCALVPHVNGLFLGAEDFTADIGTSRSAEGIEISYARQRVVIAAAAARIDSVDTPYTGTEVTDEFLADVRLARKLGFTGKACISPRHVQAVNEVFSPTQEEIAFAQRVLEAAEEGRRRGVGAVSLDGKMIDPPIEARARQVLMRAGLLGVEGGKRNG
ncbi:MAG TPA: HpcH/HpaI aldolase/citrate lyase family protein [Firmicutes bacterium]|nr:HpcH/HpaI aldolase/citrate lyase family protein [Candidatus Fermentithermobacillaceae bacterium]